MRSSITKRGCNLRAVARWAHAAGLGLLDLTPEDVQRFLDGRHISARTRYDWVSTLHAFYQWAIFAGLTDDDPTATVVRPKLRQALPRPIRDDDLHFALGQARPLVRAWLTLAAFAGLRCAEIAGLRREDTDERSGRLHIYGKGGRERIVPLHAAVMPAIRTSVGELPARGYLFRRPSGGPWPAANVSRQISTFLTDIGVDATAHQLRHWFGTRTYQASQDILVVQNLLGHSSPTTTAIYAAYSNVVAEEVVKGLTLT